ncbi:hypothetical protein BZA77DRAFT_306948 [Pyronema omphalodes]|nr:hypothetical protein BZA77DRAFT_306948 [Pyronema omphalodes]
MMFHAKRLAHWRLGGWSVALTLLLGSFGLRKWAQPSPRSPTTMVQINRSNQTKGNYSFEKFDFCICVPSNMC